MENPCMDFEFSKEMSSESKQVLRFLKQCVLQRERVYLYIGSTVFEQVGGPAYSGVLYSAMLPEKCLEKALDRYDSWDLHLGEGMPYADCEGRKRSYYRFGGHKEEPIVYYRSSPCGGYPEYLELSEEFRLFWDLYEVFESPKKRQYLIFSRTGQKTIVAEIDGDKVWVLKPLLLHYLYVRRRVLSVFWDVSGDDSLVKDDWREQRQGKFWRAYVAGTTMGGAYVATRGKLILKGKKEEPTVNHYVEFIVSGHNGELVSSTCNPDLLADYFGKNPEAPLYMAPTFFSPEVLNKYYADTTKYSVGDESIMCNGCWGLRFDNSHKDCVCVALGDLGRDLPYEEQLYWKSFELKNPKSRTYSKTAWSRFFEGKFAEPQALDLLLKERFEEFSEKWRSKFGWYLFLPLEEGDRHYFSGFHLLTSDTNIKDFEAQVLALTKIFIDSLNERELSRGVSNLKNGARGIDKFEAFLATKFEVEVPGMIEQFRLVQGLRSSSVAHRKSSKLSSRIVDYFGIGKKSYGLILREIVEGFLKTLGTLTALCEGRARKVA